MLPRGRFGLVTLRDSRLFVVVSFSSLEIKYPTPEIAAIVGSTLAVDGELRPERCKREVTHSDCIVKACVLVGRSDSIF